MKLNVGRVFSESWTMVKQRFWLLVAMWAVFFVIQIVYSSTLGGVLGGSMFAFGMMGAGLEEPGAILGGLGIGMFLLALIFQLGYFAITLGSQAATAILGSPILKPDFGAALVGGLKAGVSLIASTVLLMIGFGIVFGVIALIFGLVLYSGDTAVGIAFLLLLPALVYLGLRFSMLVPVTAVDGVLNPLTALRTTWRITKGNVFGILLVTIGVILIALVFLGLPMLLIFGAVGLTALGDGAVDAASSLAAIGSILGAFLLLVPLFIAFSVVSVVINACIHAQLTDSETERLEETFA